MFCFRLISTIFIFLCSTISAFGQIEDCFNGLDDDGDNLIDLFDHDCDCRENFIVDGTFVEYPDDCYTIGCGAWENTGNGSPEIYQPDNLSFYPFSASGFSHDDDTFAAGGVRYDMDGLGKSEFLGNCLSQPMIAGTEYRFSLEIGGSSVDALVEDFEIILFGVAKCDSLSVFNLNNTELICDVTSPKEELARINLFGMQLGWNYFTVDFTPTTDIEAIFFSIDCDFVPTVDQYNYVHYDNVVITPVIDIPPISVSGNLCADDIVLWVEEDPMANYIWYLDSLEIIGEGSNTLDLSDTNVGIDHLYHLNILSADGTCTLLGPVILPDTVHTSLEEIELCYDDSFTLPNGNIVQGNSIDTFMMTASNGCDSIAIYEVSYFPELSYSYLINSECGVNNLVFDQNDEIYQISIDGVSYGSNLIIEELTIGFHELEIIDTRGCVYVEDFEIIDPPPFVYTLLQSSPICPGSMTGFLEIQSTQGIQSLILDNQEFEYPITFDNLLAGDYDLTIIDGEGCQHTLEVTIEELDLPDVFLVDTAEINIYDEYFLELIAMIPDESVYNWSPAEFLSCTDCPNPIFTGPESAEVSVQLSHQGCTQEYTQFINVDDDLNVYIPNVFNPDSQSGNNLFGAFTPLGFEQFSMSIFDRWGNMVYNIENASELTLIGMEPSNKN